MLGRSFGFSSRLFGNNIEIDKISLIGLGSVVINSCDSNSVYAGTPARNISDIK